MVCSPLEPEAFSSVEEAVAATLKLPAKLLIKLHLWFLPQAIKLRRQVGGEGRFSFLRLGLAGAFGWQPH